MFIVGPRFTVMSPEFKRWLKEPQEYQLYTKAKEINCRIGKHYVYGCERVFYTIVLPDGSYFHQGKTKQSRYIFDRHEAYKMLKRIEKTSSNEKRVLSTDGTD